MDLVTSFEGVAVASVPPGEYHLSSRQVLEFRGSTYSWQLVLQVPTQGLRVELSNDNALVEKSGSPAPPPLKLQQSVWEDFRPLFEALRKFSTDGPGP